MVGDLIYQPASVVQKQYTRNKKTATVLNRKTALKNKLPLLIAEEQHTPNTAVNPSQA